MLREPPFSRISPRIAYLDRVFSLAKCFHKHYLIMIQAQVAECPLPGKVCWGHHASQAAVTLVYIFHRTPWPHRGDSAFCGAWHPQRGHSQLEVTVFPSVCFPHQIQNLWQILLKKKKDKTFIVEFFENTLTYKRENKNYCRLGCNLRPNCW